MQRAKPIDLAMETARRRNKYFKNYKKVCRKIKEIAKKVLSDKHLKVLAFGSVVRKNFGPLSDLDVLIISKKVKMSVEELAKIRLKIKEEIKDYFAPLDIHLVTPEIYENWYKKFIDVFEEI